MNKTNNTPLKNTGSQMVDANKYQDLEGVTLQKLDFGLWWLKNRTKLKNLVVIFLGIVSAISWGYTLFNWTYYFLVLQKQDDEMVRIMAQTSTVPYVYLQARAAKNLSVSSVYMLESGEKYDLYTIIKNPNLKHWGIIEYCFIEGSENIDCEKGFILPGESKYIMSLAHDFKVRPRNIKFMVNDVAWVKTNPHDIPNWKIYEKEHLNFSVENVKFTPASESELTEKVNLNVLEFTITNNTPYSYYEMPLNIVLSRSNTVVSVNQYTIKDFRSNKPENIKITWSGFVGSITEAEIKANINIIKKDIYSP